MSSVPAEQIEQTGQAAEQVAQPPANDPAPTGAKPAKRKRKCYMLHDPKTFECKGRFCSTGPRFAAQKAASRGHTNILLRETNTKKVYSYTGNIVKLDQPQVIQRGDQTITYTKKSVVKTSRKPFIYDGTLPDDDTCNVPENPKATPEEAS
jgi:hypothetical protein